MALRADSLVWGSSTRIRSGRTTVSPSAETWDWPRMSPPDSPQPVRMAPEALLPGIVGKTILPSPQAIWVGSPSKVWPRHRRGSPSSSRIACSSRLKSAHSSALKRSMFFILSSSSLPLSAVAAIRQTKRHWPVRMAQRAAIRNSVLLPEPRGMARANSSRSRIARSVDSIAFRWSFDQFQWHAPGK